MSIEQMDDYGDGYDWEEDWQPGQCDNCTGSTAEELERAAKPGALISIFPVCACATGQGAPADACVCGPGGAT